MDFYRSMNQLGIDRFRESRGSLDKIIEAHESTATVSEDSLKVSLIRKLEYDDSTDEIFNTIEFADRVFRTLRLASRHRTKALNIIINSKIVDIYIDSITELYGLIIQYYFTGVCDNICRVYDFGIMYINGLYIAYAILQKVENNIDYFFFIRLTNIKI